MDAIINQELIIMNKKDVSQALHQYIPTQPSDEAKKKENSWRGLLLMVPNCTFKGVQH